MATVSKVTGSTSGHPSTRRKPYYVENTIDNSLFDPSSGDVIQALNIPAETMILNAGLEVLTAASSSVTFDLGDADDPDRYVDGDTNATGHAAPVAHASNSGHVYGSADTLDVTTGGAADTAGKIRVYAIMCDVSGSDETASNSS
jgi:hypothetical protein|tara:strand:+ start:542 stop:976 length:435 start_codon:yes stop_codon:yes gene_type:complete